MKNKNKKNIPDAIDLTQLDKNTFGFMTHDEFFTIHEISYIADIDIKALEEVIPKLNLKIDSLYSKKDILKIINQLHEEKINDIKNQKVEKTSKKNKQINGAIQKVEKTSKKNKQINGAIQKVKTKKIKYVRENYYFSHGEIASLAGKSIEEVRNAIYNLNFNYSDSFNKKESILIINYLANPNKYETHKTSFMERSKTVSGSEWALIIGGTALVAGGLAWYFTRNRRAAKIAAGVTTSYISSSWQYSNQNNGGSYSSLTTTRQLISPSIGEIIYDNSGGISPVYVGPRGGRYTIGSTGKKRYF
tara:strand:+ start:410 stop:1321 length:912 start_codon:yes stop_codon:yes gene_type:complete